MITKEHKIIRKKYRNRYKIKNVNKKNLPRLSVFRSGNNFYAQIIDDQKGCTVAACSTLQEDIKKLIDKTGNIQAAKVVGEKIAELAIKQGIKEIVFDRGAFLYHGRVKASAEAARKKGLIF